MSYDDQQVLREFSERQGIHYPLLSDIDSEVIRLYGILNDQVSPGDALLHGIPYPGVYVCDGEGVVIAKSFHDSYKKRDSPEVLLDAALGRIELDASSPHASGGDEQVRVTAALHGGGGTIRQGVVRHVVVRFELDDGLHVYGEPVPEGMIPVTVDVSGEPGLEVGDAILPPTERLHLASADVDLEVWSGVVDLQIPVYATGELASEVRPLDKPSTRIRVDVRYQACDDDVCLLPKSESFELEAPLDVVDVPNVGMHTGHGQREGNYDGAPHLRRLMWRKIKASPLGFLRFIGRTIKLEREARRRARDADQGGARS